MTRGDNREFKVAGVKNLMKTDYAVPYDLIDVDAEISDHLSMAENWKKVKSRVLLLSPKSHVRSK